MFSDGLFGYACFNTQPPEGGWAVAAVFPMRRFVSTHSRPKAAGVTLDIRLNKIISFNTQPPEGGWSVSALMAEVQSCFNTQPPEGGWTAI